MLEIVAASFRGARSGYSFEVVMSDTIEIQLLLKAHGTVTAPNVGFSLFDRMNNLVFSTSTLQRQLPLSSMRSGDDKIVTFRVKLSVSPGEYTFALGCAEPDASDPRISFTHHRLLGMGPVTVSAQHNGVLPFHGFAELPVEVFQEE